MKINRNRYSHNFKSTIFIDFQYQSINCYWLLLIIIDFIDYRKPLIDNAGIPRLFAIQTCTPISLLYGGGRHKVTFCWKERDQDQERKWDFWRTYKTHQQEVRE